MSDIPRNITQPALHQQEPKSIETSDSPSKSKETMKKTTHNSRRSKRNNLEKAGSDACIISQEDVGTGDSHSIEEAPEEHEQCFKEFVEDSQNSKHSIHSACAPVEVSESNELEEAKATLTSKTLALGTTTSAQTCDGSSSALPFSSSSTSGESPLHPVREPGELDHRNSSSLPSLKSMETAKNEAIAILSSESSVPTAPSLKSTSEEELTAPSLLPSDRSLETPKLPVLPYGAQKQETKEYASFTQPHKGGDQMDGVMERELFTVLSESGYPSHESPHSRHGKAALHPDATGNIQSASSCEESLLFDALETVLETVESEKDVAYGETDETEDETSIRCSKKPVDLDVPSTNEDKRHAQRKRSKQSKKPSVRSQSRKETSNLETQDRKNSHNAKDIIPSLPAGTVGFGQEGECESPSPTSSSASPKYRPSISKALKRRKSVHDIVLLFETAASEQAVKDLQAQQLKEFKVLLRELEAARTNLTRLTTQRETLERMCSFAEEQLLVAQQQLQQAKAALTDA